MGFLDPFCCVALGACHCSRENMLQICYQGAPCRLQVFWEAAGVTAGVAATQAAAAGGLAYGALSDLLLLAVQGQRRGH